MSRAALEQLAVYLTETQQLIQAQRDCINARQAIGAAGSE